MKNLPDAKPNNPHQKLTIEYDSNSGNTDREIPEILNDCSE